MISKINPQISPFNGQKISNKPQKLKENISFGINPTRVAINGAGGEIGRAILNILHGRQFSTDTYRTLIRDFRNLPGQVDVAAINVGNQDRVDTIIEVLKQADSNGRWVTDIKPIVENGEPYILIGKRGEQKKIHVYGQKDVPHWLNDGIDIVVDSTGHFINRSGANKHLTQGAKRVLISAPAKYGLDEEPIPSIISGVNYNTLDLEDTIVSGASCTTNAASMLLAIINKLFGIKTVALETAHAATNSQSVLNSSAGAKGKMTLNNIIPTTSGAAKELPKILPGINFDALLVSSTRVPIDNVSSLFGAFTLNRKASVKEIQDILRKLAKSKEARMYVGETPNGSASKDALGRFENIVFMPDQIHTGAKGKFLTIKVFYDNVNGYTFSLLQTLKHMAAQMQGIETKRPIISEAMDKIL